MRLIRQAALVAALFIVTGFGLWPAVAFAQEVAAGTIAVAEPTFVQQLIAAIIPAVGVLISAVLLYGAALLKQKTGIDIEAKHRDALQSALLNGVLFALQKAGWVAGQPASLTPTILATARGYVESTVPDALKKFGIDAATDVGRATLDRLLTPKVPIAVGTIMPNGDTLVGRAP